MDENRPLVVATDEALLDEVLRLAAAVGCEIERVPDPVGARANWARAPLVILDEAAAGAGYTLPRRRGVVLVCRGAPAPTTWQRAFAAGVERVIGLPEGEADLVAALADVAEGPADESGRVLATLGGRGGAGASVLAAAVGLVVAGEGGDALLVDCDPLGGGVDLLLGAEHASGPRWPALKVNSGRVSMAALHEALPQRRHGPGLLSFVSCDREGPGPTGAAVAAVLEAGRRAGRTVVCDLPRQPGSGAVAAMERSDLVALVVPAEVRACVAARRVLQRLGERAGRVRLVVRGPAPDGLRGEQVADAVGAPLLADVRAERGLDRALERGVFTPRRGGPLWTAASAVLDAARARAGEPEPSVGVAR
jgi:secretion/DNA translocation related CpaE-like protein